MYDWIDYKLAYIQKHLEQYVKPFHEVGFHVRLEDQMIKEVKFLRSRARAHDERVFEHAWYYFLEADHVGHDDVAHLLKPIIKYYRAPEPPAFSEDYKAYFRKLDHGIDQLKKLAGTYVR